MSGLVLPQEEPNGFSIKILVWRKVVEAKLIRF